MEGIADRLAATPLGEGLSRLEIERIANAGEIRSVSAGVELLVEGRGEGSLLVVLEGEVDVLKSDEHGESRCLVSMAEASVLGEIGLVLDEPSTATVRTTSSCKLFVLDRAEFRSLVQAGDARAAALGLAVAKVLARRLQRMNEETMHLCERYEEALAEAGETRAHSEVPDLARFKEKLLSEWNF